MRFKRYRATNIPWLERLPFHWDEKNVNNLFDERREKVSDQVFPPLSVTKVGIVPQLDNVAKSSDTDNRKKVLVGDFVINSRSDRKGSSGISNYDGSVSLINTVITPRVGDKRYWHYLLKSNDFVEEFYRNGKGIVADLWTTNYQSMKSIILPIPPQKEQEQIAKFLDWKVNEIDRLINNRYKNIECLKTIWQSQLENHLSVGTPIPLKHLVKSNERSLSGKEKLDKIDYIEISDVGYGYLKNTPKKIVFSEAPSRARRLVKENDIIISTVRTYLKSIYRITKDEKYCVVSTGFSVLSPNKEVDPNYLYLKLSTNEFLDQVQKNSVGVSYPAISDTTLLSLKISIERDITEQRHVAEKLLSIKGEVDKIIDLEEKTISYYQNLKQSLISEVVVGKLDVGNIEIPKYEIVDAMVEANLCSEETVEEWA